MHCTNCGNILEEKVTVCPNCEHDMASALQVKKSKRKKFKITIILSVALVVALVFGAICFVYFSTKSEPKERKSFHDLEFSEYYEGSRVFPEVEPLLRDYFDYIEEAVDDANKNDLSSFSLPAEFYNVQSKIEGICDKYEDVKYAEARGAHLNEWFGVYNDLMVPYLKMEVHLAAGDLYAFVLEMSTGSYPTGEVNLWYEEAEKLLDEIYKVYEDENNTISEDYYFANRN